MRKVLPTGLEGAMIGNFSDVVGCCSGAVDVPEGGEGLLFDECLHDDFGHGTSANVSEADEEDRVLVRG